MARGHEAAGDRLGYLPAAPLIEQRIKRLKTDPVKFELLRCLSQAPYASRKLADLAELLSVESADAQHAMGSLLGEGLVVSREDVGGTVFAISKGLSNQAFLRKLFAEIDGEAAPTGRG
jgi:hypothetical protein